MRTFIYVLPLFLAVFGPWCLSADMLPSTTAISQVDKTLDTRRCFVAWSEETSVDTLKRGMIFIFR